MKLKYDIVWTIVLFVKFHVFSYLQTKLSRYKEEVIKRYKAIKAKNLCC
jgi:hypothetical protein